MSRHDLTDKKHHMLNRNSVLHSWHSQKGFFHMDPLLHITVWCTGLNSWELAEPTKRSITVGTRSPNVPHTVTGFIIFCQTGWHENERRPSTIVFSTPGFFFLIKLTNDQTGHFLKDNPISTERFYSNNRRCRLQEHWGSKQSCNLGSFQISCLSSIWLSLCWIISTESSNWCLSEEPPDSDKQLRLHECSRVLLFVLICSAWGRTPTGVFMWQVEKRRHLCCSSPLPQTIKHMAVWSRAHKQVLLVRTGPRWNSWGVH